MVKLSPMPLPWDTLVRATDLDSLGYDQRALVYKESTNKYLVLVVDEDVLLRCEMIWDAYADQLQMFTGKKVFVQPCKGLMLEVVDPT